MKRTILFIVYDIVSYIERKLNYLFYFINYFINNFYLKFVMYIQKNHYIFASCFSTMFLPV
jgi:hypothetical protein